MDEKVFKGQVKQVDTTIGELIEVITEIASQHTTSDQETYILASQVFDEILNQR